MITKMGLNCRIIEYGNRGHGPKKIWNWLRLKGYCPAVVGRNNEVNINNVFDDVAWY